jgi:hypothetical protein
VSGIEKSGKSEGLNYLLGCIDAFNIAAHGNGNISGAIMINTDPVTCCDITTVHGIHDYDCECDEITCPLIFIIDRIIQTDSDISETVLGSLASAGALSSINIIFPGVNYSNTANSQLPQLFDALTPLINYEELIMAKNNISGKPIVVWWDSVVENTCECGSCLNMLNALGNRHSNDYLSNIGHSNDTYYLQRLDAQAKCYHSIFDFSANIICIQNSISDSTRNADKRR